MEVQTISRGKGRSVTKLCGYITGRNLYDSYLEKTYYNSRQDVLYSRVFQPGDAPEAFGNLQYLCNKIDAAEKRCDARTAREFKGSLPNELPLQAQKQIVDAFIQKNFTSHGLCAIAAIHEGRNADNPSKNNPHAHIIVPSREVGPDGFFLKKNRAYDKREYIAIWRRDWAQEQNQAYERYGLDIRVSHESLEVQGVNRAPVAHLSRIDVQKERRGERRRAIEVPGKELERELSKTQERRLSIELVL